MRRHCACNSKYDTFFIRKSQVLFLRFFSDFSLICAAGGLLTIIVTLGPKYTGVYVEYMRFLLQKALQPPTSLVSSLRGIGDITSRKQHATICKNMHKIPFRSSMTDNVTNLSLPMSEFNESGDRNRS